MSECSLVLCEPMVSTELMNHMEPMMEEHTEENISMDNLTFHKLGIDKLSIASMANKRTERHIKRPYITSYGVIAYVQATQKILLIKKRDSYAYISFMRGNWKDVKGMKRLFTKLTYDEQRRILDNNFIELWDDLWIYEYSRCYRNGYSKAMRKFETVQNMKEILKNIFTNLNIYAEPMWEFPKGRKDNKETDVACAFREFTEETLISNMLLRFRDEIVTEEYQGTDKLLYRSIYYICEMNEMKQPTCNKTSNLRQTLSDEAETFKWCSLEECKKLLNPRRFTYLSQAFESRFSAQQPHFSLS